MSLKEREKLVAGGRESETKVGERRWEMTRAEMGNDVWPGDLPQGLFGFAWLHTALAPGWAGSLQFPHDYILSRTIKYIGVQ